MEEQENEGCRDINPGETVNHLGGVGLTGALAYTRTWRVEYTERRMRLYVNGKSGYTYHISITVSGADLYDIEMWCVRGKRKKLLGEQSDLYFEELQAAVEKLYDDTMRDTNGGVIPLG